MLNGSDASDRNAKLTASRLVAKQYRFMTAAQASSSISTLVRAIHHQYTKRGARGRSVALYTTMGQRNIDYANADSERRPDQESDCQSSSGLWRNTLWGAAG